RLVARQAEDVGRRLDQALVEKGLQLLFAQALDVEGAARDEVLQMLDALERTGQFAGATAHHRLGPAGGGLARERGVQGARAVGGKLERRGSARSVRRG